MKKGFTLIEMAVVLLIIGILAGLVLRNIGGQSVQARDTRRVGDLRILANYLAQYMAKVGQFPTTTRGFDSSQNNWPDLSSRFQAVGIFVNLPKPPSGAPYEYFPCTDAPTIVEANHFILRTRLEQTINQAPTVYEGSYNNVNPPTGWTCGAIVGCSAADPNRYYCITQ